MESSIEDRLDAEYAEAWRPGPGEKIVGEVIALSEREGAFGRYPIVTIRTADGDERALHAFHEVLAGELANLKPKLGDEIGVKYAGKDPEKGYHRYRAERADDGDSFDWGRYSAPLGGEGDDELTF